MRQFVLLLLISASITGILTGCWDRRDLEQRTSVVALALDINEKDPNLVDVGIQVPIPIQIVGAGGGGGGAGEGGIKAVRVFEGSGTTVNGALQNIQKRLNQKLFYGHTRVIVISDKVAKSNINELLDPIRRDPQIRRLLWPVVVPGRASKMLYVDTKLEQIPIMFVKEMIESGVKANHIPELSLGEFFISMSDSSLQPMLNTVSVTEKGMNWSGTSVFLGSKMVGRLKEPLVWSYMNLREEKPGGNLVIPCYEEPNKFLTFHPRRAATKITVQHSGGQVSAAYDVKIEGDIIESGCRLDFNNEAVIDRVQADIKKQYEKQAKELTDKLQNEFKSDVLGLGFYVRAHHPDIWRKVDWDKEFLKAKIHATYHVNLRRFGMSIGRQH
jgi:Ger(x)C family germination protein